MRLDADAYAAIARFDATMQQLDVRYAMVGSVARHLYGEARFGYGDIDFVADLNDSHLEPLSKMFGRPANSILPSPLDSLCGWLSDEQIESERARCICQADYIWLSHLGRRRCIALHVYIAHNYPSRWVCLQRAQRYIVRPRSGVATYLPHVEDLMIGHIVWHLDYDRFQAARMRTEHFCKRHKLNIDYLIQRATRYGRMEGPHYRYDGIRPAKCRYQQAA